MDGEFTLGKFLFYATAIIIFVTLVLWFVSQM